MPKYFFHFRGHDGLRRDHEGEDLSGLAAVREMAMAAAKEIIVGGMTGERLSLPRPVKNDRQGQLSA